MNSGVFSVILSAVLVLSVTAHPSGNIIKNDNSSKALDDGMLLVGQMGNKKFFQTNPEAYPETNWMAGVDICKSAGLEYAKIENYAEFRFVYDNLPITTPGLWVGASVKGLKTYRATAFAWEDGTEIDPAMPFHFYPDHWLCLYFDRSDHLYTDFCLSGRHRSLCQSVLI